MTYDPAEYGDRWADVYDEVHDSLDPAAAVEFLADLGRGERVLELGVGTGRLAIPLAEKGVDIVGMDSSPAIVDRLRAKPGGPDIEVVIGDMASTDPGGPYGLVFVAFNTIFCLLDQQRQIDCFENVRRALAPDGRFVLQCFVPDLSRFRDGNQTVRVLPTSDSGCLRIDASVHSPDEQRVDTHMVTLKTGAVEVLPTSLRYIWPSELDLMARLTGFVLEDRYGGWSKEAFASASTSHVSVYRPV